MRNIYFVLIISYNFCYSQVEKIELSLKEAINYAQINNATLKTADLQIKAAEAIKWETISTGLPKMNASINYSNWLKQQVSLIPAAAFDNTQSIINDANAPLYFPPIIAVLATSSVLFLYFRFSNASFVNDFTILIP